MHWVICKPKNLRLLSWLAASIQPSCSGSILGLPPSSCMWRLLFHVCWLFVCVLGFFLHVWAIFLCLWSMFLRMGSFMGPSPLGWSVKKKNHHVNWLIPGQLSYEDPNRKWGLLKLGRVPCSVFFSFPYGYPSLGGWSQYSPRKCEETTHKVREKLICIHMERITYPEMNPLEVW